MASPQGRLARRLAEYPPVVLYAGTFRGSALRRPLRMRSEMTLERPEQYRFHNGTKAVLPFAPKNTMTGWPVCATSWRCTALDAVVLTSMHNVAYYSGFLYCSFGRPYACVVTKDRMHHRQRRDRRGPAVAAEPWRQHHLHRLEARQFLARGGGGSSGRARRSGCEADHLTLLQSEKLNHFLAAQARHGYRPGDDAAADGQERRPKWR